MIVSLLAALALSQSPADVLRADAAQLGRDMVDSQLCEAIQVASIKDDYFTGTIESLFARAEALQVDRSTIDNTGEEAYKAYMAELEAKHPGEPSDEALVEFRAHCQNLLTTRPEMLGASQAD